MLTMTYVMIPPLSCSRESMLMDKAVYAITTALRNGVIFASCTPAQTETSKLAYGSRIWPHAYYCQSHLQLCHAMRHGAVSDSMKLHDDRACSTNTPLVTRPAAFL